MVPYWVKTPQWLKRLFPKEVVWDMPEIDVPVVYLTFDDGPHPQVTTAVLDMLRQYGAKATFFCVGNNVHLYPEVYNAVLADGHATGNHTYDHINGWHNAADVYTQNIQKAATLIKSDLFRPPYGRIKQAQMKALKHFENPIKVVMWDVLSGDFDKTITGEKCIANVLDNIAPGSIVVFHDSEKAWDRLSVVLPAVLQWCHNKGWAMHALPQTITT